MNTKQRQATAMMALLCTVGLQAQVVNNGGPGDYRLTLNGNAPRSFTIGGAFFTGASAFNIRGDQMGGTSVTPEVFRTIAPTTGNTFWRMFQGGTTAGFERGQLFADPANSHFNINAPNGHFLLHTQNVQRARLNGNITGPIGPNPQVEFPNINRDGFFLLSGTENAFTNPASRAPFTRLHLADNAVSGTDPVVYAQQHGFRPWQRNGITFTGNSDQSYIGHRYAGNDNTDFIIQWSDNPNGSPWGTDRMRFVFTTQFDPANTRGATSVEGLEAIRLWPRSHQDVNMGLGDFFAGNQLTPATVTDPTERLDMLTGRLRIRQLPDQPAAVDSFYVMVVDRTTLTPGNQERGVVKWVDPAIFGGGGGTGCEWEQDAPTNRLYTAWRPVGSNGNCPENDWLVGVGTASPAYKLDVDHQGSAAAPSGGLRVRYTTDQSGWSYGVKSELAATTGAALDRAVGVQGDVRTASTAGWGARGTAIADAATTSVAGGVEGNAITMSGTVISAQGAKGYVALGADATTTEAIGLYGTVEGGGTASTSYGLYSYASKGTSQTYGGYLWGNGSGGATYGVRARATGGSTNWAGWFDGDVKITNTLTVNTTVYTSDGSLKTNITPAPSCLPVINALQPKSYQFTEAATDALHLDSDQHVGLIAQELEEVLPTLVHEVTMPAKLDSLGNVLEAQWSYKGVDYVALIPYLIGAVKELSAQNAVMQQQLAACCTAPPTDSDQRMLHGNGAGMDAEGQLTPAQERLLRIAPNPFTDRTTLYCTLERAGRMQLLVNSSDGRDLRVLNEG